MAVCARRGKSIPSPLAAIAARTSRFATPEAFGTRLSVNKRRRRVPPVRPSTASAKRTERKSRPARRAALGRSERASTPIAPPVRWNRSRARSAERRRAHARPPTAARNGAPSRRAPVRALARRARATCRRAATAAHTRGPAMHRALGMHGARARGKVPAHRAMSKPRRACCFSREPVRARPIASGARGKLPLSGALRRAAPRQNSPASLTPTEAGPAVAATRAVVGASFLVSSK